METNETERRGQRRRAREAAFKYLYAYCVAGFDEPELREELRGEEGIDKEYFDRLCGGALLNFDALSAALSGVLEGYSLDRVYKVDLAILLLSMYELKECPDTPAAAVFDDAVELAKIYSSENSPSFIHGVLAKVQPIIQELKCPHK